MNHTPVNFKIDARIFMDLIEAAERAEEKLWVEYRRGAPLAKRSESWAEGERLRNALDNVRDSINANAS